MKYLLPIVLLAGCSSFKAPPTNVAPPWPDVPASMMEACPDLKTVDPTTDKLSDVITVVTDNYTQYYLCAGKMDDWNNWYNTQKKIYEKATK
jgi:hypothetical protein